MRDRETAVTRINLSPDWLGLSLSRRMTIAANTLGDDGSSLFKVNRAIGLALIFSQRSVVVISCHDKTCHFSRTGCVNIISSEDWRDRGEFVLSRLGLMLRKHCLAVSDITASSHLLVSSVSPSTLGSNIKLYFIIISGSLVLRIQIIAQLSVTCVCCSVITDVLLYLCSLSVSYIILYLIISVSSPEIFIFASPPDKIVQFSTSTCHTVTDQCSPHCFYEKHRFLN